MKSLPLLPQKLRGFPINAHPGAFGCARRHNFHEGIDLYGSSEDSVYAIEDGEVIANMPFTGSKVGMPWWLDTDALLIKDSTGYWVYGELKSHLKAGDKVEHGQYIGRLIPVLPPEKARPDIPGHAVIMLHLERYSLDYDPRWGWSSWDSWSNRPTYLLDPTPILIHIAATTNVFVKFLTY